MRPAKRPSKELLAWAAGIIEKEQREGTFGTVTLHLEGGVITRAKVERSEQPPVDNRKTPEVQSRQI